MALVTGQEEPICSFFERNIAYVTYGRPWRTLIKDFFTSQTIPAHILFGQYTFLIRSKTLLADRQSEKNVLHNAIALKYFTLVWNVILVLVEVVNFAIVEVNNFCRYELITIKLKLFDGKNACFVVLKTEG